MFTFLSRAALLLSSAAVVFTHSVVADQDAHTLPIIFIHGLTANATIAHNLVANLSTDARPFVALTSCQNECSNTERNGQVKLHIAAIRELVAKDTRFANGYTLIGHSQGGALARGVIEEMDDHKVHTFISLAGAGNGIFYGPQATDYLAGVIFLKYFAPLQDPKIYNYSQYTEEDIASGKAQLDLIKFYTANPQYDSQLSRSPVKSDWVKYSTFLPPMNNLQPSNGKATLVADQARRKANFLRIKEAHYFGSSRDETISPWQSALNSQYNDVASYQDLVTNYKNLKIIPMTETQEYIQDLYGLQTLDKRGGLFLHPTDGVSHVCWVQDQLSPRDGQLCKFQQVYEATYYPLIAPRPSQAPGNGGDGPVKGHC